MNIQRIGELYLKDEYPENRGVVFKDEYPENRGVVFKR